MLYASMFSLSGYLRIRGGHHENYTIKPESWNPSRIYESRKLVLFSRMNRATCIQ